jgi:hypothetical protein
MGFASLVSNLEVSRSSQLVSLLGRNVGIEIGQVVVILLIFPFLYLLRRTSAYMPLLTVGSLALAVLSFSWMTERIWEIDLGTDAIVDGFVQLPRAFFVVGALTIAAALFRWDSGRKNLLVSPA